MLKYSILVLVATAALVVHPTDVRADDATDARVAELFESSFSHEAKGDSQRALADMQEAIRLAPGQYVAQLRVGWLSYVKQRYDESITAYQRAIELAPRAIEPQLGQLLPLMAAKRWPAADRVARAVLAVAPRNYLASSRLAFIWFSQGKFSESEGMYKQLLDDYPGDLEMMLGLGWAQVRLAKKAEARAVFKQVLGISRQNASAKAGIEASK